MHFLTMVFLLKALVGFDWVAWRGNRCKAQTRLLPTYSGNFVLLVLSCQMRIPPLPSPPHPRDAAFTHLRISVFVWWLEPVEAKCVLCGGVGKDHVWVIEHVQAVKRQRVDF